MYTRLTTSSRAERLPPAYCDSLVDYLNDLLEGGRGGGTFFPLVEVTYWNDADQYFGSMTTLGWVFLPLCLGVGESLRTLTKRT